MAEVYWDLEWTLQQQGFDYTYDKRLYDRLRDRHARPVREHFHAGLDYQDKLARFLENHDEPRAAATFPAGSSRGRGRHHVPVAGPAVLPPGTIRGRQKRISPHLVRGPDEPVDQRLERFYDRLLAVLRQPAVRDGQWQLLECAPAWDGNWTWDCFLAFAWQGAGGERLLVAVNYAPNQSQCYVRLPFADLGRPQWRLQDLMGTRLTTGTATICRRADCTWTCLPGTATPLRWRRCLARRHLGGSPLTKASEKLQAPLRARGVTNGCLCTLFTSRAAARSRPGATRFHEKALSLLHWPVSWL